jgi:heme A synthase
MSYVRKQNSEGLTTFRVLSFVSLGLVFTVIIIGAFLSARGQGLACPDWPLCPSGFNLSSEGKYFIEYVHRLIALITAISVYATTSYSVKRFVKARRSATTTAAAVSIQIVIGMLVVYSEMDPIIVAIHTAVGAIVLALSLVTFISTYHVFTGHHASRPLLK